MDNSNRSISILIPAYNEAESIRELYDRVVVACKVCIEKKQAESYEIWFVNDGSQDETGQEIRRIIGEDIRVHLIDFRKNFGKSPALNAGFHHVNGDIVFTLDSDLQDDPKEFTRFIEKLDEGFDLVVGWKKNRFDSAEKRLPSKFFNVVTSKLSGVSLHDHDCGFKCFKKEVVDSLNIYGELHRYIPVLAFRNGFKITEITVEHHKREHGRSKYGIERYMRGALDSITTNFLLKYSDRPMYLFGRLGTFSSLIGFIICLCLTIGWILGDSLSNRPLLILGVILIVIGVQFVSIGLISNLIVDNFQKENYTESHIKEII